MAQNTGVRIVALDERNSSKYNIFWCHKRYMGSALWFQYTNPDLSISLGQREGQIFHKAQDLATDEKYIGLREWHNQWHRATNSSGPRED